MSLPLLNQSLQYFGWGLAAIEIVLGLYALAYSTWRSAYRFLSGLLGFLAAGAGALSLLLSAQTPAEARLPSLILAAVSASIQPFLLLYTVEILGIGPLFPAVKKIVRAVGVFTAAPALLGLADILFNTGLLYPALGPGFYPDSLAAFSLHAAGSLALPVRIIYLFLVPLILTGLLIYLLIANRTAASKRLWAWSFLGAQFAGLAVNFAFNGWFYPPALPLVLNAIYLLAYGTAGLQLVISGQRTDPLRALTGAALAASEGDLPQPVQLEGGGEFGQLAQAFNRMALQMRARTSSLELRLAEKEQQLKQQSDGLRAANGVAQELSALQGIEPFLERVARLISDCFVFYHTAIYLIDPAGAHAVLYAASSETGRKMRDSGCTVKISWQPLSSSPAGKDEPYITVDRDGKNIRAHNLLLPACRSEKTIALKIRRKVIGFLDLQSERDEAFSDVDLSSLYILAGQIASAVDSERLLQENRRARQELDRAGRRQAIQDWRKRLNGSRIGYRLSPRGVEKADDRERTVPEKDLHTLKLPLLLKGQPIGSLVLRKDPLQAAWSKDEIELARLLLLQVALRLENARLAEENSRQAENERLIGQVAASVRGSLDLESVMRKAVTEIGQLVQAERVQIRLENHNANQED